MFHVVGHGQNTVYVGAMDGYVHSTIMNGTPCLYINPYQCADDRPPLWENNLRFTKHCKYQYFWQFLEQKSLPHEGPFWKKTSTAA